MQKTSSPFACPMKVALFLTVAILGASFLAIVANMVFTSPSTDGSPDLAARLATPRTLSPFQLTDHHQQPLGLAQLKDHWTFLFFGYTHCPDVCPTTLSELAQAAQLLEQSPAILANTQFIFVSVDPARDTPSSLADYVTYFSPRLIGATGDLETLKKLTQQMDIKFSLETNPAGEPIVNHSSAMLLIDPQVRYYARLKAPHYAEEIQKQYLALRDNYQRSPNP